MKPSIKIISILLVLFFLSQLIGIAVINVYSPKITQVEINGTITNVTSYNLPSWVEPPKEINKDLTIRYIFIAILIGIILMLILMKLRAEIFIRIWFFVVIAIALGITINALFLGIENSAIISLLIAIPLSALKVFRRGIIIHNLTELMIYPGLAAVFVPLLDIKYTVILLIVISIYDMYAVWHAGFMQKMARYQIDKVKIFAGFFVPYLGKKQREMIKNMKSKGSKKVKMHAAMLGGGDVAFPMILAGVVLYAFGLIPALIISLGAVAGLIGLFLISEKGKFYPAMPFITAGCIVALVLVYLLF